VDTGPNSSAFLARFFGFERLQAEGSQQAGLDVVFVFMSKRQRQRLVVADTGTWF